MKSKHLICLFIGCLVASTSFSQQTTLDRPAWIKESEWLPLTKDLGLVIYETRKSSTGVVWNAIHYYEEEIKRLGKAPKNATAVLFFQDRIEQLRKQEANMPGIAESNLMARKDGKWFIVKMRDTEPKQIFHYIEENKR